MRKDWHTESTIQEDEDRNIRELMHEILDEHGPDEELKDESRHLVLFLLKRMLAIKQENLKNMTEQSEIKRKRFEDDEDEEEVEEAGHA